ncbi:hypothetical protein [Morganella morganii]|uniref:hypothetical protein n=1 Tax=Morganella morganii TaxID=582 RepID=UPI0031A0E2BC
MIKTIEEILQCYGPMASSVLREKLIAAGLTEVNARQRISRAGGDVQRFTHFSLPKKEAFLYLKKDYNSPKYWDALLESHANARTVYAHTVFALHPYQGVIPTYLFSKVSGSPDKLKGQIASSRLEMQLLKGLVLRKDTDPVLGEYYVIYINGLNDLLDTRHIRSQLLVEDILIKGVADWVRHNGLGSFNKVQVRNSQNMPSFSHHYWDLCAPSYIMPIASVQKNGINNGFIVADIIYGELDSKSIQAYITKVQRCRNMRNTRPFLAMLIADRFDQESFRLARQAGVMVTTVSNLLGQDISALLSSLLNTLNRASAIAAANPEKINELFKGLTKIEGAAINIRGVMFEMLVGHIVLKTQNVSTVDLNKQISTDTGKAEIDVIGFRGEAEIKFYECKGYEVKRLITVEMIEKWIERIQRIRKYFSQIPIYRERKMIFSFWTSSDFSPEALECLLYHKKRNVKILLDWKNGREILGIVKEDKLNSIADVLQEHYLRHPLASESNF